jgi:hypothetical protein
MTRLALIALVAGCHAGNDLGADAGANAVPSITTVRAENVELSEFARVNFERGTGTLELGLYDTNLDDTLYVKAFVDYAPTDPKPARASCDVVDSTVQRSCTLDLAGLCQTSDVGVERVMQLLVFDRQVLDNGEPLYQAMPPGGLSTSRTYFLICQDPT